MDGAAPRFGSFKLRGRLFRRGCAFSVARFCFLLSVPDSMHYSIQNQSEPEPENQPELGDKQKAIDRLLNLYIHQNNLLWSRLQALTALQIPVLGGWYFFWKNQPNWFAFGVAILGALLSLAILELTNCDGDRRDDLKKRIEPIDKAEYDLLFPDFKRWIRGRRLMQIIVIAFCFIDFGLAGGTFFLQPPAPPVALKVAP